MRTVDPEVWSKSLQRVRIKVTRPNRFGEEIQNDFESIVRKSLKLTFRQYLQMCSVSGVKLIADRHPERSGRYRGRVMVTLTLVVVVCAAWAWLTGAGLRSPLVVALHSTQRHVADIDFPAVGLCSANVISKHALRRFAKMTKDPDKRFSERNIEENLRRYGALIDFQYEDVNIEFSKYIRSLEDGHHNVSYITQQLSPSCEEMLVRCSWHGAVRSCGELFQQRATTSGYCCVFNSHHGTTGRPERLEAIGPDAGLTVMVNVNVSDYAYTLRHNIGTEVLLFDPLTYPLRESGDVLSFWLWPNVVSYLVVTARVLRATPAARTYSLPMRGCRFAEESVPPVEGAGRTYTSCLTACRARSTMQLCSCVPHFLPQLAGRQVCSPNHLGCLHKHRELFLYYYPWREYESSPPDASRDSLQEEMQNGEYCSECIPDCERVYYRALHYGTKYSENNSAMLQHAFTHGLSIRNRSMLQVFYKTAEQDLYTYDVAVHWYQTISELGGMWIIVAGVSLVSLSEFLYFFTVKWLYNFTKIRQNCMNFKMHKL